MNHLLTSPTILGENPLPLEQIRRQRTKMTKLVFNSLENIEQNFAVLELIPDTHAWVKDRDGLFVFGNRLFYERFGFSSMRGLVGKTDYDLAPVDMAQHYCADDDRVLEGGAVLGIA